MRALRTGDRDIPSSACGRDSDPQHNWLGKSVLLGDRFKVPDRGQQGCVALIVRALQRAGVKFEQRPSDMMPSDLAKRFGVLP